MLDLLHPAVVHFPIALILVSVGLTFYHLRRPDPWLERSAYGALVLGWWGSVAALLTGLLAAAVQWPFADHVLLWINLHALSGFALLYSAGQAVLLRKRQPAILVSAGRRRYLGWLLVSALLISVSGWIGGHLVYGLNVR